MWPGHGGLYVLHVFGLKCAVHLDSTVRERLEVLEVAASTRSTGIRWSGSAAILGGSLWALWYVGVYTIGLVVPRYEGYEAYNRLMPFVLVLLLAGLTGAYAQLRRNNKLAGSTGLDPVQHRLYRRIGLVGFVLAALGLLVMIAGNVAEFWAFTDDAYGRGTLRDYSWMAFGLGMIILYGGTVLFAVAALAASMLSRLAALPLLIWFPMGFVLSGLLQLVGVPEGLALSGINGLCGLGWVLLGCTLHSNNNAIEHGAAAA